MVLVWSYLARGNVGHTLVVVAINSPTLLVRYGGISGYLLGVVLESSIQRRLQFCIFVLAS